MSWVDQESSSTKRGLIFSVAMLLAQECRCGGPPGPLADRVAARQQQRTRDSVVDRSRQSLLDMRLQPFSQWRSEPAQQADARRYCREIADHGANLSGCVGGD